MSNGNGKFDKGRYVTIPETRNIKLPIGGTIKLGLKVKNEKGIEHPLETDYFVCPKEIRRVFGEEPTELTVFFPEANREKIFPQAYEKYGSNEAMQCWGDGETSGQKLNLENGRWEDVKCPCENFGKKGGCGKVGHLKFMIPSVSIGTFYELEVKGTVSMQEVNSGLELARITTGGHWAMIPFRMRRVPKKIRIPGTANMKTHWVVTLEIAASVEEIRRVIEGEILYLGQRKNGHYELEAPELPLANRAYVPLSTEEEKLERLKKQEEYQEQSRKEYLESKENEAKLKKEHEEGKDKIKSYQESKTIYKKKKEEGEKIEAEINPASLEEVTVLLKEIDIQNWSQGLYYARKANLKVGDALVATIPQLKKLLTEDRDQINRIVDARGVKEGTAEKYFKKLNEEDDPDEALA
jgi:hypothetical protein